SSIDAYGRAAHGAQPQKRVLRDADLARDVVLAQGVEIGGDPFAAEFFPPHFIARSAGLPRVVKAGHSAPRAGGSTGRRAAPILQHSVTDFSGHGARCAPQAYSGFAPVQENCRRGPSRDVAPALRAGPFESGRQSKTRAGPRAILLPALVAY